MKLTVNGVEHDLDIAPDTPCSGRCATTEADRHEIWLRRRACGACTVHVDGERHVLPDPAGRGAPARIVTIEGCRQRRLRGAGGLARADVRNAAIASPARSCPPPACWPTIPSRPTRDIDDAMDGNLCRCGDLCRIRAAIQRALAPNIKNHVRGLFFFLRAPMTSDPSSPRRGFRRAGRRPGVSASLPARLRRIGRDTGRSRPNPFVRIDAEFDRVTVVVKHLDKGQGIATGLAHPGRGRTRRRLVADARRIAPADNAKPYNEPLFRSAAGHRRLDNRWPTHSSNTGMAGASPARCWFRPRPQAMAGSSVPKSASPRGDCAHRSGKSARFGDLAVKATRHADAIGCDTQGSVATSP